MQYEVCSMQSGYTICLKILFNSSSHYYIGRFKDCCYYNLLHKFLVCFCLLVSAHLNHFCSTGALLLGIFFLLCRFFNGGRHFGDRCCNSGQHFFILFGDGRASDWASNIFFLFFFFLLFRGPGWLGGCTLLSNKVQSAGWNSRKVNGFTHPGLPPLGNSDYGGYDRAERRKRLNWARGFIVAGGGHAPHLFRLCPQW